MSSLGVDQLNPAEQLRLVDEILEHLGASQEPFELSEAHRAELDRRLVLLDAGEMPLHDWGDVEGRILERLRGSNRVERLSQPGNHPLPELECTNQRY